MSTTGRSVDHPGSAPRQDAHPETPPVHGSSPTPALQLLNPHLRPDSSWHGLSRSADRVTIKEVTSGLGVPSTQARQFACIISPAACSRSGVKLTFMMATSRGLVNIPRSKRVKPAGRRIAEALGCRAQRPTPFSVGGRNGTCERVSKKAKTPPANPPAPSAEQ